MVFTNASFDAFLILAIAIIVPTALYIRQQQHVWSSRNMLSIFVVAHSLYMLYVLTFRWPPNIFQRLHIPLTTPLDSIRATLLERAGLDGDAGLPKSLETLLSRLSSFDMRMLYVRFGQTALQDCEHCVTFDEYALFALPRALLGYVREAAVLGLITIKGSGRERWRTYAIGALVCTAVMEGYWITTVPIRIPQEGQDVLMWHDNLWLLRQLVFLLLPIIAHRMPNSPPSSATLAPTLTATRTEMERALSRLNSLRFSRGAVLRDPTLRAAATEWWERQRQEGEWARSDEGVRRMAARLGKGLEDAMDGQAPGESRLKKKAEEVTAFLTNDRTMCLV
ncbi:hypothetical protein A0H81_02705 [Grifola frondosa]|uniref:Uncharacterized protein n=1 Tax=Grifola frondosa TaxID=5627 RepID=A0A1C7MKT7_GRIFR|nr:hypothetical protein A0H81_02705 [Grifola frondosa]